jgi:hypothetical protein
VNIDAGHFAEELIAALERRPELVQRLVGLLIRPTPEAQFVRVAEYAKRLNLSERHGWSLVSLGLPTIGTGKARRVDVRAADQWLREQPARVEGAVERRARADASARARRVAGGMK